MIPSIIHSQNQKSQEILPTPPHQAGVAHILKSSPTFQNSYLSTCISALPVNQTYQWVMNNKCCFLCKSNWLIIAFHNCSHICPPNSNRSRHAIDILTCVTLTISFSDFFSFSLKFSFLQVTVTPFSPKISCFSRVYTSFPQITQKILICRHLPLTGTDHCNSRLLKIITDFRTCYIFFSKFKVPLFKSNIGWIAC